MADVAGDGDGYWDGDGCGDEDEDEDGNGATCSHFIVGRLSKMALT